MRYEPALRHGIIVGLLALVLHWLGLEFSEAHRGAVDNLVEALVVLLPLGQALAQALLTRRRVVPVAKIEDGDYIVPLVHPGRHYEGH